MGADLADSNHGVRRRDRGRSLREMDRGVDRFGDCLARAFRSLSGARFIWRWREAMIGELIWERDGRDWPHRGFSRFVAAAGLRWHVQVMGVGPPMLLAHGAGAATHSWRGLAPRLARAFTVIAPDLPGHGFTDAPPDGRLSLAGMARALSELVAVFGLPPSIAVGHGAGAALLLRMALDGAIAPRAVVSLNGALLPFGGAAAPLFSPLSRLLFLNPIAPRLVAWRAANPGAVSRAIESSGSMIDEQGLALYARLFKSRTHCAASLGMMGSWNLAPLAHELPRLKANLLLVACGNDKAVPSSAASRVRALAPNASVAFLRGLGHLAHEEDPGKIAAVIMRAARAAHVLDGT